MPTKQTQTRRDFLRTSGIGAAACIMGGIPGIKCTARQKPVNVLFIAIDDLNDWVGCLGGHPDIRTPNIDRLVSRGILFTSAYCAAPACNPSRAALMTGIRPSTSGVYRNSQDWRTSDVLETRTTLPQHFMAHGYKAMGAGKIYHGNYEHPESWDYYENIPGGATPPKDKLPLNGIPGTAQFDWGPLEGRATEDMPDWKVADWTVKELQKEHDKPFFLGCGIYKPHLPWFVPTNYFDRYPLKSVTLPLVNEKDLDDVPPLGVKMANPGKDHANVLKYDQWARAVQGYLACISFVDDCIGHVIEGLDSSPYKDNTIVVLWSDHGWHLGQKLHWRKFALWEEATHNILAFIAPGMIKEGQRCDAPVNLLDIYPTLVDLCRLRPMEGLEGVSLMPLCNNPQADWERPSLTTYMKDNHSLRSPKWRYIRYADGSEELYDHDSDELEWQNLANDTKYSDVKKELSRWLPVINAPELKESE